MIGFGFVSLGFEKTPRQQNSGAFLGSPRKPTGWVTQLETHGVQLHAQLCSSGGMPTNHSQFGDAGMGTVTNWFVTYCNRTTNLD